jgi:hypothetical protein
VLSGEVAARWEEGASRGAMSSAGQGLEVLFGRASAQEEQLDDDSVPGGAATASRARGGAWRAATAAGRLKYPPVSSLCD